MNVFGLSDVGKKRSNNQDCFEVVKLSESATMAIVCDGMGGANGGNVASVLARDIIVGRVKDSWRDAVNDKTVKNIFESAILAANITVFDKAISDESLSGMGTTAVTAVITHDHIYIANVGDSRAYLLNGSRSPSLEQITVDHSIVQMLVESGQITSDEAQNHPKRNIITRAVGVSDNVKIDFFSAKLEAGDKLLLCSDGLSGFVSNEQITEIVLNNDAETAAKLLIDEANNNGGGDNITAVVAEI